MAMSFVAAATSTWWCPGPSGGSRAHLSFPVAKNKHLRVTIAAEGNAKTAPAQAVPWRTGLFGFVPLAAHGLYADGLSTWSLLCWRYLFALVIILAGIRPCPAAPAAPRCGKAPGKSPSSASASGRYRPSAISRVCAGSTPYRGAAVPYLPGGDSWRRKRHFTLRLMVPRDLRGKV